MFESELCTKVKDAIPVEVREALQPLVQLVETVNECIERYDQKIEELGRKKYGPTTLLRQVKGTVEIAYEGKVEPTTVGVPQGSPISPLYSNIYLNLLDQVWHRRGYPEKLGATLHRYADDGILVCRKDATQALQAFEGIALRMGLTINREKTRITKLTEGFDFIGFEFVKRRSPNSGKLSIYIHPSKSSQRNIRRRIKSFTKRRAPIRPAEFVQQVNQTVRGWVNYYRHTNASDAFRRLQRFINTRFRRYLNYRSKGRGFGWKKYPKCGSVRPGNALHRERSESTAHAVGRRLSDRRTREN